VKLVNETGCAAALLRADMGDGFMRNALVVRLRCRYDDGALAPLPTELQRRTVRVEAEALGSTRVAPDGFFPRRGCDVIVVGDALPEAASATTMRVRVEAGPYDVIARVTGDRVWERVHGGLVPSAPGAFAAMPIAWSRAFGGRARGPYGELPYSDNPEGRGYYLGEDEAEGAPLPNVEHEGALVRAWDDRPQPLTFEAVPQGSALHLVHAVSGDEGGVSLHPERGLFDRAHPCLSGQPLDPGAWVRITGMSRGAPIAFQVPLCPVEAELRFDALAHVRAPGLEELVVDARTGEVELCWRYAFRYQRRARQRRVLTVRPCEV
jgi:hypothetical protein